MNFTILLLFISPHCLITNKSLLNTSTKDHLSSHTGKQWKMLRFIPSHSECHSHTPNTQANIGILRAVWNTWLWLLLFYISQPCRSYLIMYVYCVCVFYSCSITITFYHKKTDFISAAKSQRTKRPLT